MQAGGDRGRLGALIDRGIAADVAVAEPALETLDLDLLAAPGQLSCHVVGRQLDRRQIEQIQHRSRIRTLRLEAAFDPFRRTELVDATLEPDAGVLDRHLEADRARAIAPLLDVGGDAVALDRPRGQAELGGERAECGTLQQQVGARVREVRDAAFVGALRFERIAAHRSPQGEGGAAVLMREIALDLGARHLVGVGHLETRQQRAELGRIEREPCREAFERGREVGDFAVDAKARTLGLDICLDLRTIGAGLDRGLDAKRRQIGLAEPEAGEKRRERRLGVDLGGGIEPLEAGERIRLRENPRLADRRLDRRGLAHRGTVEKLGQRSALDADLQGGVLQPTARAQLRALVAPETAASLLESKLCIDRCRNIGVSHQGVADDQSLDPRHLRRRTVLLVLGPVELALRRAREMELGTLDRDLGQLDATAQQRQEAHARAQLPDAGEVRMPVGGPGRIGDAERSEAQGNGAALIAE